MNTDALFNSLLLTSQHSLGLIDITLALFVPFLLSFIATWVYQKVQSTNNYSAAFVQAFFLFACLSSIMTMIIGNNIARAFGLIGALSIIRFRNALKSPVDAVYIFWALAIGMSCGTGFYLTALYLTITIAGFALILNVLKIGEASQFSCVMRIEINDAHSSQIYEQIEKLLQKSKAHYSQLNVLVDSELNHKIYIYSLRDKSQSHLDAILHQVEKLQGIQRIQKMTHEPSLFAA